METQFWLDQLNKNQLKGACLDHYGHRLAAYGGEGGEIFVFVRNTSNLWQVQARLLSPEYTGIRQIAWSHPIFSSSLIASINCNDELCIWEEKHSKHWEMVYSKRFHCKLICLSFAPTQRRLSVASASGETFLLSLQIESWICKRIFEWQEGISSLAWYCNGNESDILLVGGARGGAIFAFKRREWELVSSLSHPGGVNHVSWVPNSLTKASSYHMMAALAGNDGMCNLWKIDRDWKSTLFQTMLHEKGNSKVRMEWNTSGDLLVTTGGNGVCKLWTPDSRDQWLLQETL